MDIELSNYGATIVSVHMAGRSGKRDNIVAGFSNLNDYLGDHPYLGCVVGRYANRIAFGNFTLDGIQYTLDVNDGVNHLHGGFSGFNRKVWQTETLFRTDEDAGVELSCFSPDGEGGFPGSLKVKVRYSLGTDNRLHLQYEASAGKPTVLSLTNHSYFNLSGFREPTIVNHLAQIFADYYTMKNENNVPDGTLAPVTDTPLDFRTPKRLGEDILKIEIDRGYDHNFVIRKDKKSPAPAADLYDELSGRGLKVYTDQPGMQLYTANWWNGTLKGSQGKPYEKHGAVALETQAFPDSPNHPHFPSTVLRPGETFFSETIFEFYVR